MCLRKLVCLVSLMTTKEFKLGGQTFFTKYLWLSKSCKGTRRAKQSEKLKNKKVKEKKGISSPFFSIIQET